MEGKWPLILNSQGSIPNSKLIGCRNILIICNHRPGRNHACMQISYLPLATSLGYESCDVMQVIYCRIFRACCNVEIKFLLLIKKNWKATFSFYASELFQGKSIFTQTMSRWVTCTLLKNKTKAVRSPQSLHRGPKGSRGSLRDLTNCYRLSSFKHKVETNC